MLSSDTMPLKEGFLQNAQEIPQGEKPMEHTEQSQQGTIDVETSQEDYIPVIRIPKPEPETVRTTYKDIDANTSSQLPFQ